MLVHKVGTSTIYSSLLSSQLPIKQHLVSTLQDPTPSTHASNINIHTTAMTTTNPSSAIQSRGSSSNGKSTGGQEYMRKLSRQDRAILSTGKLVEIMDSHGTHLADFPLALFNAASSKKELVVNSKIVIPDNLDISQVKRLLSSMKKLPTASYVGNFPAEEKTLIDLQFHSAAEALGMSSFTQHIFNLYYKRVNTQVHWNVANIEAIATVRTPSGDKIYQKMANNIGTQYSDDKMPNRASFERYLATNERLQKAVAEVVHRKEVAAQRQLQAKENKAAFLERERKRQEKAHATAEHNKSVRAKESAARALYKEREQKEMAVRKSMLEKKRGGEMLNAEEAHAYEKLFGKAIPQQASL
jgi:hypothetical protein